MGSQVNKKETAFTFAGPGARGQYGRLPLATAAWARLYSS